MCKVLIVSGIKKEYRTKALEFYKLMAKEMTPHNNDGCGYAAVDSEGQLFGERWFNNYEAFTTPNNYMDVIKEKFGDGADTKASMQYNSFGVINQEDIAAITLHTRFATTTKSLQNVHPFYYSDADTSLIHNGVINNHEEYKKYVSTCDSEAILNRYTANEIAVAPQNMQDMANELMGYYACGVFSRDNNGERILDVFNGKNTNVYINYIHELEAFTLCTSNRDVLDVCKRLGWKTEESVQLKDGNFYRFNPFNGDIIYKDVFTPKEKEVRTYWNDYREYRNVMDASNKGNKKMNKGIAKMLALIPNVKELTGDEKEDVMEELYSVS